MRTVTKSIFIVLIILFVTGCNGECIDGWLEPENVTLEAVATSSRQWTGIAVSQEGRIFVNYPLWSPSQPFAVGELQPDGTVTPYPDEAINSWQPGKAPKDHFVCVQAMYVDTRNRLWILDSGTGRLLAVDSLTGHSESVAVLPGYTRGLAFCGPCAFVGLSRIRESSTFGGVPIAEQIQQLTEKGVL